MKINWMLSFIAVGISTAAELVAVTVELPPRVTAALTITHIVFAVLGFGVGVVATIQRKWVSLFAVVLCVLYLWVQYYWFRECG